MGEGREEEGRRLDRAASVELSVLLLESEGCEGSGRREGDEWREGTERTACSRSETAYGLVDGRRGALPRTGLGDLTSALMNTCNQTFAILECRPKIFQELFGSCLISSRPEVQLASAERLV